MPITKHFVTCVLVVLGLNATIISSLMMMMMMMIHAWQSSYWRNLYYTKFIKTLNQLRTR